METLKHCAYNQTSDCFLSLDVAVGDFTSVGLSARMPTLTPTSGKGLWMVPFRGIPAAGVRVPLDLVYLDEDCKVIEVVESFPTFRVSPSSPPAASVLALPIHSIYSSQTQPGHQLVVCTAEDLDRRLKRFSTSGAVANGPQNVASQTKEPLEGRGLSPSQLEDLPVTESPESEQESRASRFEPGNQNTKKSRSWLQRLLSPDPPDPRRAQREPIPGLTAYFWTGATPEPHPVRDVSATGLYVVTEDRWYPGTMVRMTLTKKDDNGQNSENSICVHSRAVRWGNDGVGLQFVLQDNRNSRVGDTPVDGADRKQLDEFLEQFRSKES